MSLRSPARYSVLAGLFLLGSVVLFIAIAFSLTSAMEFLKPAHKFVVKFPVAQGAPGVKAGNSVTLGGQIVGRVTGVEFDPATENVLVAIRIAAEHKLYANALIALDRPLLGSQSTINISGIGTPDKGLLKDGDTILGGLAPPALLTQAGLSSEKIKAMVDDLQATLKSARTLVESNSPKINTIIDDVGAVTKSTRESWPKWTANIDSTTTDIAEFSKTLKPMAENFNARVDDFGKLVGNVNSVVDENKATLRDTISQAKGAVEDVRTQSIPLLNDGLKNFREASVATNNWMATELPSLRRTVANLRLTSDQANRAIGEIRAQPWRLFFQPAKKDLEADALFRAATYYADATAAVRATSESLTNAMALAQASPAGTGPTPETIAEQLKLLRDSMQEYKKAERDLLDVLILQAGQKPPVPKGMEPKESK
jgi:ABC-type transporter Mla subunit MlaD